MSTKSVISTDELSRQIQQGFVNQSFEVLLINSPNLEYEPGITPDANFLNNQVASGTAGYEPQVLRYLADDETNYSDGGVALKTKAAIFLNDNSGTYQFTHVCLKRGNDNVVSVGTPTVIPSEGTTATILGIPTIPDPLSSASGLTVDIAVSNDGAASSDYEITVNRAGFGYSVGDTITVSLAFLVDAGAAPPTATGDLQFEVTAVSVSNGAIVSVTPTENTVVMADGNEAVFYFNLKQYGFAS